MALLDSIKKAFSRTGADAKTTKVHSQSTEEGPGQDLHVPEVTSTQLLAEIGSGNGKAPLLLDIREQFERAQTFIPNSVHIPMNSVPSRLEELDRDQDIVVYCAHGNRSYGVAGWLIKQGYKARSLKGGIVDWQHKHGPIESGYRGRS
jgi:rhodanese-related sulfurtransferase